MTIKELLANASICSTSNVSGLSLQIIAEMNALIPNVMVDFADLNVAPGSSAVNPFLQPAARQGLRLAIQERGKTLPVRSAYRTIAQQLLLFRWFRAGRCDIPLAAAPSKSNHENGLALDIPPGIGDFEQWKTALRHHNWIWLGPSDPPHFTFEGAGVRHDVAQVGVKAFQQLWNRHHPSDQLVVDGDYGLETERRLEISPAEGFGDGTGASRLLRVTDPLMRGEDVGAVQHALRAAGVELTSDGIYGTVTEAAVKQFQNVHGLKPDGVVGPMTRIALGLPA